MARRPIGFDVSGMAEDYKNPGSTQKPAVGGSSSKGNYNQPGMMVNRNMTLKPAKGYIDADGKVGENIPKEGARPMKGMGYKSNPKYRSGAVTRSRTGLIPDSDQ